MSEQQLEQRCKATADAQGSATFIFDPVPQSLTWWGSVQIIDAPFSALHTALVTLAGIPNEGTPWGEWGGPLAYSIVRAEGRQQLVINTTGLTPGLEYNATWLGISDDSGEPIPQFPTAISGPQIFPTNPFLAVNITAGTAFVSALFPVSNVKGLRIRARNNRVAPVGAPTLLTLQWASATKGVVTAITGTRYVLVPPNSGTALFQCPHMGDFLLITLGTFGAPALSFELEATNVDNAEVLWSEQAVADGLGDPFIPNTLLKFDAPVNAASLVTIVPVPQSIFAGPAMFSVSTDATAAWNATLQAQNDDGTWENLVVLDDAMTPAFTPGFPTSFPQAGNVNVGPLATVQILAPPPAGFVNRIRTLTSRALVAPAANLTTSWNTTTAANAILYHRTAAVIGDGDELPVDFFTTDGISFANATAVNYRCGIYAEQYPLQSSTGHPPVMVMVPAAPIRVVYTNLDPVNQHTPSVSLVADMWRD